MTRQWRAQKCPNSQESKRISPRAQNFRGAVKLFPYHWSRGGAPYGAQEPNRSALQQRRGGCRDRSELKNRTEQNLLESRLGRKLPAPLYATASSCVTYYCTGYSFSSASRNRVVVVVRGVHTHHNLATTHIYMDTKKAESGYHPSNDRLTSQERRHAHGPNASPSWISSQREVPEAVRGGFLLLHALQAAPQLGVASRRRRRHRCRLRIHRYEQQVLVRALGVTRGPNASA